MTIKEQAEEIRDERLPGNNTAKKVGGVLVALAESNDKKADKDLLNIDTKVIQEKVGIYESEYTDDTDASRRFIALKVWDDADNNRSIGITSEGEPFITLLDPEENPERIPLALADMSNVPAIKAVDVSELDSATDNGCIYLVKDSYYMFNTRYIMTVTRVDTGSKFTVQTRLSVNGVEQRSKGDDDVWTSWSNILKVATKTNDGLMPLSDKQKLDSIIPVRVNVNAAINTSTLEDKGRTIPFLSEELSMADIITMTDSGFRFMFYYTYNDNGTLKTGSLDFETSYEYTQTLSFYNASKTITIDLIESSKGGQVNVEISLSE